MSDAELKCYIESIPAMKSGEQIDALCLAFGWEVVALFNGRLVKLKMHFFKIVEVNPVDEAAWRRAFGDPETRGL